VGEETGDVLFGVLPTRIRKVGEWYYVQKFQTLKGKSGGRKRRVEFFSKKAFDRGR